MVQDDFRRKLTAILSADVVGYSRLMGKDEAATVRTLNEYREVMTTLIQQHSGRVLDSKGDNLLAEFSSVVEAVLCAVAVQKEIKARNGKLPKDRRMVFRIGVNLGDVIDNGESIYGDGVNIAARLESLADPGGICISKTAFDHIESKLPFGYQYMGDQAVKNIAKPVPAYRVLMEPDSAGRVFREKRYKLRTWKWSAIAGVAVIVAGVAIWNFILQTAPVPVDLASDKKIATKLPEKPFIAVLPFENLSGDPKQDYIADGITDDLITDLSQISGLAVVASYSSFAYKGKPVKVNQVAKELNVQYVLEGSLRRAGEQVRINAQLIEASTGQHLWAERYNRNLKELYAVQNEIIMEILAALHIELTEIERDRLLAKDSDEVKAFYTDKPADVGQRETPVEKSLKAQLIFWESIKDSKDRKMFEEYLKKFPQGIFTGLAEINIHKYSKRGTIKTKPSAIQKKEQQVKISTPASQKSKKPEKQAIAPKKSQEENYEIIFWKSIENSTNIAVFQEYLNRFPNGTFAGLAKIKIKDLAEDESKKLAALAKPKEEEKKKIPTVAEESPKRDTQPSKESPKKAESVKEKRDAQIEETKKLKDIEKKKDEKQTALHLLQEKEVEKVVKTSQALEEFRPDNMIELAVFPWHVKLQFREGWGGISSKALKAGAIDGLKKFLAENKLVIPRFSYYDLGKEINENNIKGNLLTENIVNDLWIKKGFFSKRQLNIELINQLGDQLQVDAILMYDMLYGTGTAEADIHLIDVKAKKIYSKTEKIFAHTVRLNINNLTEKLFFEYVSKKYQLHPNYELILWEYIKESKNTKQFQEYLSRFPNGTFAGLAELKIERLSKDKSKKFRESDKKDSKTITKKKLEVAIFPWRFKLPQWFADPPPSLIACLNGIFDIIQKYDEIELKYSYYENKKFKPAKVELIKSLIENNEKEFWVKKSLLSEFQPNFDVIYDYGEQISADLVLLTAIESSSVMENIKVYLVDINNKKIYEAIDRRPDRPLETLLALSEKTIENFLQETKKAN